jgi:O-acetyl-ADP-ribose deacetylase (regulator of RNase III)
MKITKGDLLDDFIVGEFDVIIHGCNCFRAMASGIAGQITKRIPEAKFADDLYGSDGDIEKLSHWSSVPVRRPDPNIPMGIVINLYTQFKPGADLYEEALLLGFKKLSKSLKKGTKIGIPKIGCGVAGGDWKLIGPKIAEIMKEHDLTLVEYEQEKVLD